MLGCARILVISCRLLEIVELTGETVWTTSSLSLERSPEKQNLLVRHSYADMCKATEIRNFANTCGWFLHSKLSFIILRIIVKLVKLSDSTRLKLSTKCLNSMEEKETSSESILQWLIMHALGTLFNISKQI